MRRARRAIRTARRRSIRPCYLYDNFPGGIGLSEPLFRAAPVLVREAIDLVEACECSGGCPACVGPVPGEDDPAQSTQRERAAAVLALLGA